MPDHRPTGETSPPRGDAAGEVTAGSWSRGAVIRLGTVDSTNRYAIDAARAGRSGGFVVVCDHQSAGRGRRGRAWIEPPGGSLLCSFLFRPRLGAGSPAVLTFAVALAALDAIEATTSVRGTLKWPNDVLLDGRKVAGVLGELPTDVGDLSPSAVVVGIGMNLHFPPGWLEAHDGDDERPIAERATTVEVATGVRVEPDVMLAALLEALDRWSGPEPGDEIVAPVIAGVRGRLATIGQRVEVHEAQGTWIGRATGLTESGRLLVESGGTERSLDAGDVTHLR